MSRGIIYEYEDGGKYCGEWEDDLAHGYGVCTGPKGSGLFEGSWEKGNQASGVFTWPTGQKYMGQWQDGVRQGVGKEIRPDGTEYAGEFSRDARGPFGVLRLPNGAVYSGSWVKGVQDGEGVETYIDGGVYRGQYKNGLRHGNGTRSSAVYEHSEREPTARAKRTSNASLAPTLSTNSLKKMEDESLANALAMPTAMSTQVEKSTGESASANENSQIYEGEWKDDKRHGHGVLKVLNLYTYYGEWDQNARTGYGVLVHSKGRKEEGQWQNGRLVNILKRKKLQVSLRSHQLDSKVKHAHTLALQAADSARNRAILAESRASLAGTKASAAQKTAQQALRDAQNARDKSDLHRNAPRVAEALKSPMHEVQMEFPALKSRGSGSRLSAGGTASSLLTVQKPVHAAPSYEDIQSIYRESEPNSEHLIGDQHSSIDSEASLDSVASRRREQFLHRHSSGSSVAEEEEGSFEGSDLMGLTRRRQQLKKLNQVSESENFEPRIPEGKRPRRSSEGTPHSHLSVVHTRSRSLEEEEEEEEEEGEEGESLAELRRRRSGRRVDKTTGEVGHGDATDDESLEERKGNTESASQKFLPPPPHPLEKKASLNIDMLMQMADWNRMVAYINFALLIFLLILIIIVVFLMNYYHLSHASMPQSPAGFMTPMA